MKRRKSRFTERFIPAMWAAVLVVLAAVSLAACGSKSAVTVPVSETTAAAAGDMAYASLKAEDSAGIMNQASYVQEDSEGSGLRDTSEAAGPTDTSRKLIRDVDMNVESRDFDVVLSQITSRVSELGGYVESSNVSGISVSTYGGSQQRFADIRARIPADKLDGFVKTVETAANVTNKQEQVTDVTLQYSDIESRRKSLEIEQERLWALLEKADSLDAVVALESRLSEIRYQLESYISQLRLYDNQVSYSTVSIYMVEVKDLTPTAPDSVGTRIQKGFNRSLSQLEETGVGFIVWLAASSPILLVLAVVIGIIVLAAGRIGKRIARRKNSRGRLFHPNDNSRKEPGTSGGHGKEQDQREADKE